MMPSAAELAAAALENPAMAEATREEFIGALFTKNRALLPDPVLAALQRGPDVVLKAEKLYEVERIIKVANRSESATTLGLPSQEYHVLRTQFDIDQDRSMPVTIQPRVDIATEPVIPQQGGIQVDISALTTVRINEEERTVTAYCGAPWKSVLDAVRRERYVLPSFPSVPLDFSAHDLVAGTGTLRCILLPLASCIRTMDLALPSGERVDTGGRAVSHVPVGYSFHGLLASLGRNTGVPLAIDFELLPKTAAYGTFMVATEDGSVGSTMEDVLALDLPALRVDGYDSRTAEILRGPGSSAVVEVTLASHPAGIVASKELLSERFGEASRRMSKVEGLFERPAGEFSKTSERLLRHLFVGQVALPATRVDGFLEQLGGMMQPGTVWGYFAALNANGSVLVTPHFVDQRMRDRIFDLTKALTAAAAKAGGTVLGSQLAPLLGADKQTSARHRFISRIRAGMDLASVLEPDDAVKGF